MKLIKFGLVVVLVSAIPSLSYTDEQKVISISTLMELQSVQDPQISPDGERVAYVLRTPNVMTDTWYTNVWLANMDGSEATLLTSGEFRDSSPRWSPDGTRLAYVSNRNGNPQILVHSMESRESIAITEPGRPPADIAWSPDGSQIAFTSIVAAQLTAPVALPPKPEGAKWAAPARVIERMHYRMDGIGFLPEGFRQIFVVSSTGGTARQVSFDNFDHSGPEWSSDGSSLLISATPDGGDSDSIYPDLYSITVADGTTTQLTSTNGPELKPAQSPDGRHIAYTGFTNQGFSYTVTNLYVADADGSNVRQLAPELDRDVWQPQWSADGTEIFFLSNDRGSQHLFRANLEGQVRPLSSGDVYINSYDVSANGNIVALVTSSESPPELVSFSVDDPSFTELTSVSQTVLGDIVLGEVEEIWYTAPDRREVQGWIVKPPDFDSSRKYPLILYIHGGPHSMYGIQFRHDFQVLAANGYVVLYTNPRGSTGYGQEWGNLIQFEYPGGANFSDLMSGVDSVIGRGYIDSARLGVTGGSGGGLMTAWTITHTDRFSAAVAQYPSINWFSLALTTDFPANLHGRRFKSWPWEDPDEYLRVSPIMYVASARTPTMLITGEEDWRTPISQSEEFFTALKAMKVDTRLVRIPDEPHGIGRFHISHAMAKQAYLLDWFDRYLVPESAKE